MVENEKSSSVVLLHEHPELLKICSEFVNKQWKRSNSARLQSLEKSYKELPDSLILLDKSNPEGSIIGHSRLTRVLEDSDGCWIGSVLISEEKRGRGFGKYLMKRTEDYAKSLGFNIAYLNTKDQEGFYEHIGYSYCEAVSSISFKLNDIKLTPSFNLFKRPETTQNSMTKRANTLSLNNSLPQIPPPPPLPNIRTITQPLVKTNLGQFWMKKELS